MDGVEIQMNVLVLVQAMLCLSPHLTATRRQPARCWKATATPNYTAVLLSPEG